MKNSQIAIIVGGVGVLGVGAWLIFREKPVGVAQGGAVANTAYVGSSQYYPYTVPQAARQDQGTGANQPWSAPTAIPGVPNSLSGLQAFSSDLGAAVNGLKAISDGYNTIQDIIDWF